MERFMKVVEVEALRLYENELLDYFETKFSFSQILGAVYFLYNEKTLLYIGKTKRLKSRICMHLTGNSNTEEFSNQITHVKYLLVNDDSKRSLLEGVFIYLLKPPHNNEIKGHKPNKHRKISDEIVIKIKKLLIEGYTCSEVSRKVNIDSRQISNIAREVGYKDIYVEGFSPNIVVSGVGLKSKQVIHVKECFIKGYGVRETSKITGVNEGTVGRISREEVYKDIYVEGFSPNIVKRKIGKKSILTEQMVVRIYLLCITTNIKDKALIQMFNISRGAIQGISQKKNWLEVTNRIDEEIEALGINEVCKKYNLEVAN